jgi:hypothetical protein
MPQPVLKIRLYNSAAGLKLMNHSAQVQGARLMVFTPEGHVRASLDLKTIDSWTIDGQHNPPATTASK